MWYCKYLLIFQFLYVVSCQETSRKSTIKTDILAGKTTVQQTLKHATKFSISKKGDITCIKVLSPWKDLKKNFSYALIPKSKKKLIPIDHSLYNAVVYTPIQNIVVTSTSHIPFLERLGVISSLKGFPTPNYISSTKARNMINKGLIKDLGQNNQMNLEVLLDLEPELVMGFSVDQYNVEYKKIEQFNIPLVYNGDWTEKTPLGRAEWIKFFAPFFQKEELGNKIFNEIEQNYLNAKKLAQNTKQNPTVLSGDMYQNVWYLPGGKSFQAQLLKDAHAEYLWSDTEETGSLALSLESVMDKALKANYWIGPVSHKSYQSVKNSSQHYTYFSAYKNKKVFSVANTVGETGGSLYYELGPLQPDVVLKDLIKALHPEVLPNYQPYFFKPLSLN